MGFDVAVDGFQVVDDASGGFRVGEDHRLDRLGRVGFQGVAEGLGIQGLAPFRLDDFHFKAIGLGHLHPALAEFAVVAADHLVAATEHVDDSGFHGRRAAASEHQHIAFGLVQPLQLLGGAGHDLLELPAAVADGMACHRQEHPFRHRSGAGDHQLKLVLHAAGWGGRNPAGGSFTLKSSR